MKFTAIVVTYNEEKRITGCLESLDFCAEILVFDLGSIDNSVRFSEECGARVIRTKWVPIVEEVWRNAIGFASNEWIIRADPDEVFPKTLVPQIVNTIDKSRHIATISLPHQYYFKNLRLNTTYWGGIKYIPKVFNKHRVCFSSNVHNGIKPLNGYKSLKIDFTTDAIQHYWIDSYSQLFSKHWRYLKFEGKSRYDKGERFSWKYFFDQILSSLRMNLWRYNGIRGGWLGVFLSFFYVWYVAMGLLSLRKYQKLL